MGQPEICVVHLARKKNGIEPLKEFLESYRAHNAGIAHDLLIVFKGFKDDSDLGEYSSVLEGVCHRSLFIEDTGFDIGAYFTAARNFEYKYFCFLNSYSVILHSDWLAKMHRHITGDNVGLVGASGSYESLYSNLLEHMAAMKEAPSTKPQLNFRGKVVDSLITGWNLITFKWWPRMIARYRDKRMLENARRSFYPFPNYHIRTNAFLISRNTLLSLRTQGIDSKTGALAFESGKRSLTRQLIEMKVKAVVVGQDGNAYEKEHWYESHTFRSGDQENLLIADNRTRQFVEADFKLRTLLKRIAWGEVN